MNAGALLDAVVADLTSRPKATPKRPKVDRPSDGAKHEPFSQCPHCLVFNAYKIVIPAAVHYRKLDGTIDIRYEGEGYFECKYCHAVDMTKGKGHKK